MSGFIHSVSSVLLVQTGEVPVLIVADDLARARVRGDENASKDTGKMVQAADQRRRATGACILFLAHLDKSKGWLRGHSALKGAIDTEIKAERQKAGTLTLKCEKQKNSCEFQPITLGARLVPMFDGEDSFVLVAADDDEVSAARAERIANTPEGTDRRKMQQYVDLLHALSPDAPVTQQALMEAITSKGTLDIQEHSTQVPCHGDE